MKTIIIIVLLGYFVPVLGFILVHFHDDWNKSWAKVRWWSVIYLLGIFGILTEWIMFFPAWWTRKIPIIKWVFWIWMDDSRFKSELSLPLKYRYADDYYEFLKGKEETIWKAYQWHMRNRVWNLDSLLSPKQGDSIIVDMVIDELYMNDEKVDQSAPWFPMARLKYWEDGVQGDQINSGAFISKKHSIFGTGYLFERIGGTLSFRYSKLSSFLGRWLLLVFGYNGKRNAFTIKWKRKKPIK